MVKLGIQIIEFFYKRKRLEYKNIVHIESMSGKLQTTFSQKTCPVNDRMHENVMPDTHASHLFPGKYAVCRHGRSILHDPFSLLTHFIINIIADEHIHRIRSGNQFF